MSEQEENYELNWYKTQVKCCKELALKAKERGDERMEHYYTQESLNYLTRVKSLEEG